MYLFIQDGGMYYFTYHRILIRLSEEEEWSWVPREFPTYDAALSYAYKYFRGIKREYIQVVSAENKEFAEALRLKMNSELNLKPIEKKEEWDGKFKEEEMNHLNFIQWLLRFKNVFDEDMKAERVPITEPLPIVEVK